MDKANWKRESSHALESCNETWYRNYQHSTQGRDNANIYETFRRKKNTDEIADNAKLSHAERFLTDKPDPHDEKIT